MPRHRCLVNGEARADLDVSDRGLAYGDGLFETIAIRAGRPCCWLAHLDRLARGAVRLGLPVPSPARLKQEATRLGDGVECGILKIILTRGPAARGYRPPPEPKPTRILMLTEQSPPSIEARISDRAARVRVCQTRLGINSQLAGLKHLNRLEQVLARSEWADASADEGLMLDAEGRLVCGTMSNLFLIDEDGVLQTPLIDRCGVAGTARARVLDDARAAGLEVRERRLALTDVVRARGAFLTNAVIGIWPIRTVEEHAFELSRLPWTLLERVHARLLQPELEW
ncbi:aminodeoxychorismate lyase [Halochromatium salexigens]|uniref:Aminodeoxychorismate lyase n=1 Tax=Halochromatium salexigens TaxID=49447 RepID=A0AAJ0XE91_HALSE|nr:aminodeoxychorismate lyase [Halochromatium salexigens]MBK5929549.1 aminodeoxychorismate lyase [Halochromatium salexigens]